MSAVGQLVQDCNFPCDCTGGAGTQVARYLEGGSGNVLNGGYSQELAFNISLPFPYNGFPAGLEIQTSGSISATSFETNRDGSQAYPTSGIFFFSITDSLFGNLLVDVGPLTALGGSNFWTAPIQAVYLFPNYKALGPIFLVTTFYPTYAPNPLSIGVNTQSKGPTLSTTIIL